MSTSTPTTKGPWRVVVWDVSDPDDARWLLATVGPVLPAGLARRHPDESVTAWLAGATGLAGPVLTSMPGALAWRVDESTGTD
jgi:hypothetical protein